MPLSIDGAESEVLPRVDQTALCGLLRRLPHNELDEVLRHRILCAVKLPGAEFHVACGTLALSHARARGLRIIAYAEAPDFLAAVRSAHGQFLIDRAALGLMRHWPAYSASRPLTAAQAAVIAALGGFAWYLAFQLPPQFAVAGFAAVGGLFFLSVVVLRMMCFLPAAPRETWPGAAAAAAAEPVLPAYSVLVPLFRETRVLPQLTGALASLRYPAERLDIKLIIEDNDLPMRRAVAALKLDSRFEVIVVPAGKPRTKPRALNYALPFCRGALLTVYDAEDIPDPDQLLKAARSFARLPPEVACLQAQLTFYNPDENWLARQFAAEYAVLFGLLLPALDSHHLPLPLGGTSNHFRIEVLRAIGGWDPFNVTEDADLGLRLARLGYKAAILDSFTHEEANTRPGNWLAQRSRWLKGFLLTWLVHMRAPVKLRRQLGLRGFWIMQALTLGVFVSALLYPSGLVLVLAFYGSGGMLRQNASVALNCLLGVNLVAFIAGHASAILLMRRGARSHGLRCSWIAVATVPLYWCLMSAAAWLALWQFATQPFHWNKTEHGLSRQPAAVRALPDARSSAHLRDSLRS
ncbi:MAG: glycosyltransferase family 2 protein [Aestuariivirga sp.]|uniref:glycosyltransferase family 2 protein n=1 Tax=Aestuariivirga sp. TaxID=2650926 RepID=UPI0038D112AD